MERDGKQTSLWQKEQNYSGKHTQVPDQIFDVVIVGGGMTGIATAMQLQKAGRQCLVAEAYNLCFGTTGGTTAHLNTFMDTTYDQIIKDFGEKDAQLLAKAARQALDLVKENIAAYQIDCGHSDKEGFIYAQDEKQVQQLDELFKASQKAGVSVSYTDTIPVKVEFKKAVVYHGQAQFHPTQYVLQLARAFEAAGGVILQNCFINNVTDKEPLMIDSSLGIIRSRKLIYATHIPPGINLLHFRNAPYRSYAIAVTLKDNNYPDHLAYDMYDPYHYYRTQEVDGQKYLIVGGEDHKTAHEQNTERCFLNLEAYLSRYYAIDKVAYKWSSQYYEPSDGLPYIGQLPGSSENIYVATGYGGNGMTYSHIAAITLSALITRDNSTYEELFDPARVKMVAGFAAFVKENADVVAQFFGKRIGQDKLQTLADLAAGDARVVKYDGESIAIYKDEAGKLFAVNPVCTHAKCVVGWNRAEKTWDCPCHGARYDVDGKVLTGPARKGLEVVSLESVGFK